MLGRDWRTTLLALAAAAFFVFSVAHMRKISVLKPDAEMQVALPRFVQVIMAAGDRYLAANIGAIRALVVTTARMDANAYHILGLIQSDVAWLNPRHEDNYYIAAAILPWNGQLAAAQNILRHAVDGRPFDFWPTFYYAFDIYYFLHDPKTAADLLRAGALRTDDEQDRLAAEQVAALWYQKGADPRAAAIMIRVMARSSRYPRFRDYLETCARRLDGLASLADAATRYQMQFGQPPQALNDLVTSHIIAAIPQDPFGFGYGLDGKGNPILFERPQR